MAKLPFIPFYPNDWLRDTRRLSAQTKAAWIDILAIAWNEPERGIYHRTQEAMFRELGLTKEIWDDFMAIELAEVAEIIEEGDGLVTVISRRMVKEEKHRELNRIRTHRYRSSRGSNGVRHAEVTEDISHVTLQKSEVIGQKEEKKRTPAARPPFQKPTAEEVAAFTATEGLKIDVAHFMDYYVSNGWKVGRNPMKDWKSTVRNWARRDQHGPGTNGRAKNQAVNPIDGKYAAVTR